MFAAIALASPTTSRTIAVITDELKNDVVLNLRRDSLNILQLAQKDSKKSVALKHKENTTSLMRVELVDDYQTDYQLPKISSTSASTAGLNREPPRDTSNRDAPIRDASNKERKEPSVRRDISQDSLDEQPNGCDYIGINSTLNCSTLNNGLGASVGSKFSVVHDAIAEHSEPPNKHPVIASAVTSTVASPADRHPIDKQHVDRQIGRNLYDPIIVDRNVDKEKQQTKAPTEYACKIYQQQPTPKSNNEHRNLVNSSNVTPASKATNQSSAANHLTSTASFEVPVLIETPCTPEPPADDECSTESNSETPSAGYTTPQNCSFDNESENNLSKRKRTKRRIENPEEIDALFNGRHFGESESSLSEFTIRIPIPKF